MPFSRARPWERHHCWLRTISWQNHNNHIVGRRLRKKAKGVFMKREELEALELTSEQVNAVMKLYGKSVTELQSGLN